MTFGSPPVPFLRILRDPHTHEQVVTHEMRPPAEHDFANLEQLRDAVQGAKPRLFGNQAGDEGVRQGHNVQHAENETKTEDDRFPTFRAPRRRTRQERPPHHAHVQTSEEREVGHTRKTGYGHVSGGGDLCSVLEKVTLFDIRITSRVRLCRSTMACFSMAGLHAVTRMHTITACSRRPFEPMRATLHDAREPAALAGFCSRSPRVKPHALRHTKQSIWMDQARRHGRALGDTRSPRRWAMAPSNESIDLRKAKLFAVNMFPAGACFPCLRFLLPKLRVLTKLFSLFEANLKITVSLRRSKTKTMPNDG